MGSYVNLQRDVVVHPLLLPNVSNLELVLNSGQSSNSRTLCEVKHVEVYRSHLSTYGICVLIQDICLDGMGIITADVGFDDTASAI